VKAVLILHFVCALSFAQTNDWLIVPGVRLGPLTASSGRADLERIFGAAQVADRPVGMGDGSSRPGTVVYGDNPSEALAILWTDETRARPEQVQVCYGLKQGTCRWHTSSAIGMNTSLRDLESANGGPFILLGFERDFAGTVLSWEGGKLARDLEGTGRVVLRLSSPDLSQLSAIEEAAVLADRVRSDQPAMRKLNPEVYRILVVFPRP
jgi:hypothetical protein